MRGLLEGIYCVAQDFVADKRFQGFAVSQVDLDAQQIPDVKFQAGILKDPDWLSRIQVHQDIDIAVRSCLTTGTEPKTDK
jgi:hypothetical protein